MQEGGLSSESGSRMEKWNIQKVESDLVSD